MCLLWSAFKVTHFIFCCTQNLNFCSLKIVKSIFCNLTFVSNILLLYTKMRSIEINVKTLIEQQIQKVLILSIWVSLLHHSLLLDYFFTSLVGRSNAREKVILFDSIGWVNLITANFIGWQDSTNYYLSHFWLWLSQTDLKNATLTHRRYCRVK